MTKKRNLSCRLFLSNGARERRNMTTTQETHQTPTRKEVDRLTQSRALPALLDFWTLCDFIGMRKDRSTRLFAWRGAKNGTFPAPVKLSEARIAWRRDEVERWLSERPRAIYSKAKDREEPGADRDARAAVWVESNWPKDSAPLTRADLEGLLSALRPPEDLAGPILTLLLNAPEQKREPIMITQTPKACPVCGSTLTASGAVYVCADDHGGRCDWAARVDGASDAA